MKFYKHLVLNHIMNMVAVWGQAVICRYCRNNRLDPARVATLVMSS